jgi:hypothetical protein
MFLSATVCTTKCSVQKFYILQTERICVISIPSDQFPARRIYFFQHNLDFPKHHCCLKYPRLGPFVFLPRVVPKMMSMSLDVLTIYFSYVRSVMSYGIVFWGNLYHSTNIIKIQKRIIRIITNIGRRNSCRQLFKQLQILTLPSQYVFSLLLFVNKIREMFLPNSEIHDINTRYNYNLHLPSTNLALVQKGVL